MKSPLRQYIFIIFLILVLIGVGGYYAWLVQSEVREARFAIDKARAEAEIRLDRSKQQTQLAGRYEELVQNTNLLRRVFIYPDDLVSTIREMERLADIAGVRVVLDIQEASVKKQPVKAKTATSNTSDTKKSDEQKKLEAEAEKRKMYFLVEVTGSYKNTLRYMDALESMLPVATFESLHMERYEPKEDKNNQENALEADTGAVSGGEIEVDEGNIAQEAQEVVTRITLSFMRLDEKK